ncbi:OLC1v1028890C1 [Oldenlandia corymbosa var. corymbosa]|uniref:OLC1v1028890C1 n=1 Tax=Oldenlandia corymbosa var. corymbosa TaxID=529605 RepID=A0AAV1CFW3_OLDCO|nr:OLC1v1028890C1 [Oldenlandia corymbosa var. corymbosa]
MDTELRYSATAEDPMAAIREAKLQLATRVETLHDAQLELIASLVQTLVPDLVSSLDPSLKTISSFNPGRPFIPLPIPVSRPQKRKALSIPKSEPLIMVNKQKKKLSAQSLLSIDGVPPTAEDDGGVELDDIVASKPLESKQPYYQSNSEFKCCNLGPPASISNIGGGGFRNPREIPPPSPGDGKRSRSEEEDDMKEIEALFNKKSFCEQQKSKVGEELVDLIHRPTAKEAAMAAKFKSKVSQVREYCTAATKEDCRCQSGSFIACQKVHFRRIIAHTDVTTGNCPFLDTCRNMKTTCPHVHYVLDSTPDMPALGALTPPKLLTPQRDVHYCSEVELGEPQWINCDIRNFKMDILGHYGVIMADPPWDIHIELPYGTMAHDEMRTLNVPALQTDGLIFLWVTERAMELGRECLELWGYKRVEEITWVKINQLQHTIKTGRTGHWLNHSKEPCLVGIKGNPQINRNIDTDVIVSEVRETSRKPDEMYSLLQRIMTEARKLELFARVHTCHPGWMSLGNQLNGVRLVDEGLRARSKAAYPDVEVQPSSLPRSGVRNSLGEGVSKTLGAPHVQATNPTAYDFSVEALAS